MKSLITLSLFFLLPFQLLAQDSRLRLKQADILESKIIDGESIQILTGNVLFQKEKTIINCDIAQFNRKTENGSLLGNVVVLKEDQTLTCDSLYIDGPNDILTAYGHTHVWDSTYNLVSDTLIYFDQIDSGLALGNVELIQDKQTITAHRIEYLKSVETEGVSYAARGKVSIKEEERKATCGEAIYDRDREQTTLRINPEIQENGQTISGSQIFLQYRDKQLQSLFIPKQAHATYLSKGKREWNEIVGTDTLMHSSPIEFFDDMTGVKLRGYFMDGKLDSMRLEGMATTLYHIFEDSIYQGKNKASGDTVIMSFGEEDIDRIFIKGGSRGTYTPDTTNHSIEGSISYGSEDIDYDVTKEETELHGDATIDYSHMNLNAGFINVAWKSNVLRALPESPLDSVYTVLRPTILEEGQDPMVGEAMVYNLKTRHGRVVKGKTQAEDAYYHGKEIRNREKNVFYVEEGIYTTCDLDEPHFHFESQKMKMINEDKVIARPIVLYISRIPILGLPFGVFPHKKGGRHSGWIMPGYGESSLRGQYIDGLGYFWAPNDYMNSKLTTSFADRQGITLRLSNDYKKRYSFSGSLFLESRQSFPSSYTRSERDISQLFNNRQSDYVLRWNHTHEMRKNQSLMVNASYYSSGDYNRRTGIDLNRRLEQQAVSNATYSKRWPKSNNSISLNLSSTRDLMVEQKVDSSSIFYQTPTRAESQLQITNNTLPQLRFSHSSRDLFPTKAVEKNWYNTIKYGYGATFNNRLRTYYESEAYAIDDTTDGFRWKRDGNGNPLVNTFSDYFMNHTSSISAPQKLFRYVTVSPGISLRSAWVNRTIAGTIDSSGQLVKIESPGFAARTTGSMSLSMKTTAYGMFPVKFATLNGIRHTMTPSISYSYTPDFSKPQFGYYETVYPDSGEGILYDRFSGTLAGGTPKGERQSINLSFNNVFQAKLIQDGTETKKDLFSWRLSASHNFAAEEFKWSNMTSSIRTNISKKQSFDLSMSHSFYEFDETLGKQINIFRTSNGIPVPRLLDVRLSTGFSFSGNRFGFVDSVEPEPELQLQPKQAEESTFLQNLQERSDIQNEGKQLWRTRISLSYTFNNSNPINPQKTFWMNTNSTIQLTQKWRVTYNARFDLIHTDLVSHSFSLYRDLHCWELSVNWTPSGYASGLYFKLNVKSPTLKDLKIEQRGGVYQRPMF